MASGRAGQITTTTTAAPSGAGPRSSRRLRAAVAAAVLVLVGALLTAASPLAGAAPTQLLGLVETGGTPLEGYEVTLYRTAPDAAPAVVGTATTDSDGEFSITHDGASDASRVYYVLARSGALTPEPDSVVLAAVLGPDPIGSVTVNPRTTVATAYAMAQFLDAGAISGPDPGVANGASMSFNVADPSTGDIGEVLATPPNGDETSARRTFNSLANLVAACVADATDCDAIRSAATPLGGTTPADSLQALRNVVVDPSHEAAQFFTLSESGPTPYGPTRDAAPAAWTLALRFDGPADAPKTLNGPGNFALDHEGTMWVANNYTYAPPGQIACASDLVMRFGPNGAYVPGSPYQGGGLSGVGYGIARDRYGAIWLSNFGFGAMECEDQPPHDTLSAFGPDGEVLSPDTGWKVEGAEWPQGMTFDPQGNLWVANCQSDNVTYVPDGDPSRARTIDDIGVSKPFDVAIGSDGNAYVTGTASDNVVVLSPEGQVVRTYGGFHRPMGIVADDAGELWISNSGLIDLPCPTKNTDFTPPPSLGHIDPVTGTATTHLGGGLTIPWGISVDGHGNIWVSDFGGLRVSEFCGRDDSPYCPEGVGKGDPISPDITGYDFDGFTRSTATHADTAGNLWATNNWKEVPQEINPGGYQVVVFLGLAGPLEVPPPEPAPVAPTTTTTTTPIGDVVTPRFTG